MANKKFKCKIGDCDCGGAYFQCEMCGDKYRCLHCGICKEECRRKEEGESDVYEIKVELFQKPRTEIDPEYEEDYDIVYVRNLQSYNGEYGWDMGEVMIIYNSQIEKWKNHPNFKVVSLTKYEFGGDDGECDEDYWYDNDD